MSNDEAVRRQDLGLGGNGGQFAPTNHGENHTVSLLERGRVEISDEDYNAEASYLFPPYPRSAEQHLAFWTTVKIPDSILDQVSNVYGLIRAQARTDLKLKDWPEFWEKMPPNERSEWARRNVHTLEDYIRVAEKQENRKRPYSIMPNEARWVVRGYMAWLRSDKLPQSEQDKVDNFQFPVGDQYLTTSQISQKYPFREMGMIDSLVTDPQIDVRDEVQRLREALTGR